MKNGIHKSSLLAIALVIALGVAMAEAQQPSSAPQQSSPSMQQPNPSMQQPSPSMQQPSSTAPTSTAQQPTSAATGVNVNPSQVQKKAGTPPPSTATPTSSVGSHVRMSTPADSQSWAEQLDADGNGTVDQATLVWDGKDRVLFSNTAGTFTCRNGASGSGELLIAVNGTGNKWGRPVGSGFWLASLDKGQCGAQTDTLWGCKFDASGTATACGAARLNEGNQDIVIVAADTRQ